MRRLDDFINDAIARHRKGREGFGVSRSSALADAAREANAGYKVADMPQFQMREQVEEEPSGWQAFLGGVAKGVPGMIGKWNTDGRNPKTGGTPPFVPEGMTIEEVDEIYPDGGADIRGEDKPRWMRDKQGSILDPDTSQMELGDGTISGTVTDETFQPPSKSNATYQQLMELFNKDYRKEGKDYDKDHDWKDILKSVGIQALQGLATAPRNQGVKGMLGAALGGGISGGVAGALDRNADNKMLDKLKIGQLLPQYEAEYGIEQKREQDSRKKRKEEAEIDYLEQKPGLAEQKAALAEFKALNDAEYKQNVIALGKEKADEVKANNERIYQLKVRGADQNDQRIKLLEKRNAEIERHNRVTEKNAVDRESNLNRRQQIAIEARRVAAELERANKNNQQDKALAAREKLKQLKKEDDELVFNASGEGIPKSQ